MKNLILLLSITIGLSACSTIKEKKPVSQMSNEEVEAIYKKEVKDSKQKKVIALLTSTPRLDVVSDFTEFYYVIYSDSNKGGFALPLDCKIKFLGKFDPKLDSYVLYKGIAKSFCPKADFKGVEKEAVKVIKK